MWVKVYLTEIRIEICPKGQIRAFGAVTPIEMG